LLQLTASWLGLDPKRRQNLAGVIVKVDLLDHARDPAVALDHKGLAVGVLALRQAVSGADLLVGVDQQRRGEAKLVAECDVALRRVIADAKAGDLMLVDLSLAVTQRAKLLGSARRVVLGIEDQRNWALADVVSEADWVAALVDRLKDGGRLADLWDCHDGGPYGLRFRIGLH